MNDNMTLAENRHASAPSQPPALPSREILERSSADELWALYRCNGGRSDLDLRELLLRSEQLLNLRVKDVGLLGALLSALRHDLGLAL
jgi:hypothetical protein